MKEMTGKQKIVKSNDRAYKYKLRNSWLIGNSGVILDHKWINQPAGKKKKKSSYAKMNTQEHYT